MREAAPSTPSEPPLFLVGSMPPPLDGQSVAFSLLVRELRGCGVPVHVFDISPRRDALGFAGPLARVRDYARLLPRFALSLLRYGPSRVYLTLSQSGPGFVRDAAFIWLSALARSRSIGHLHGGNYGAFYRRQGGVARAFIRATLRRTDKLIVLGEGLRPVFDFDAKLAERIRVVPNGVDLPDRPVEAKRWPVDAEPLRLLFLSNLVESKGYFEVLEALRILVQELGIEAECDFCGAFLPNPSDDRRVRDAVQARELFDRFVEAHDLGRRARYRGVVSGDEKVRLLREAHVLALPSRYDNEGQPIAIIEAMAHGCVVVATGYRAIPDLVEQDVTGIQLRAEGEALARELAGAIASLHADPKRFEAMSRAAIARYRERFTARAHLDRMRGILMPGAEERPA